MKSKNTEIQQIYRDIKRIYKKIMDLKPFEKYGRNDCFHFMDEKDQGMPAVRSDCQKHIVCLSRVQKAADVQNTFRCI